MRQQEEKTKYEAPVIEMQVLLQEITAAMAPTSGVQFD